MITRRWLMDEWRDAFLLEARLRQLPGDKIGEALAEVDTHCADSRLRPDQAFGDPIAYARTLAGNIQPPARTPIFPGPPQTAAMALATIGGIFAVLNGVDAIAHGTPGTVTLGQALATLAGTLALVFITTVVFGPGRRHVRRWLGAAGFVGLAVPLYLVSALNQTVLRADGWVLLISGPLLLAAAWRSPWSKRVTDRIVDPRTGTEPFRCPGLLWAIFGIPELVLLVVVVIVLIVLPA